MSYPGCSTGCSIPPASLDFAGLEDAGRTLGQEDGHRVVVRLGEELAGSRGDNDHDDNYSRPSDIHIKGLWHHSRQPFVSLRVCIVATTVGGRFVALLL